MNMEPQKNKLGKQMLASVCEFPLADF
jgi:hypothetical protein